MGNVSLEVFEKSLNFFVQKRVRTLLMATIVVIDGVSGVN